MRNPLQNVGDTLAARSPKQALARAKALLGRGQPARAVKLLEAAARTGMVEALHEMGMRYLTGEGVPHLDVPLMTATDVPRLGLPGRAMAVLSKFVTGT